MNKLFSIGRRVAITAAAGVTLLASCTTAQIEQAEAQIQTVIANATSISCGIIPDAISIINVVNVLYPGIPLLALAPGALSAVEQEICTAAPPVASARYRAIPRRGVKSSAVIGQSQHGVVVTGWR
jgi:hypothetical protein